MVKHSHKWIPTIGEVKFNKRVKPIHYERVRGVIAELKDLLKKEGDPEVRQALSKAGIELSNILLK